MASYRGAAVKILQLLHQSKHGFAKAVVRTVTHDSDSTDTVNYADLTPLGDIRPELLVPRDIDMGLVFYEDNNRVLSGNIIDVDGVEPQVHASDDATVQANKKEHRFVPLYLNSKGDKVPREKPNAKFAPCVQCVNQSQTHRCWRQPQLRNSWCQSRRYRRCDPEESLCHPSQCTVMTHNH